MDTVIELSYTRFISHILFMIFCTIGFSVAMFMVFDSIKRLIKKLITK